MSVTEEELEQVQTFFPDMMRKVQWKPVWMIDCFRYRTQPEDCDPEGCSKCSHWKELEKIYNS